MRPCSTALAAFLADRGNDYAQIVDLFTFSLADTSVLRYSGWSSAITVPAGSFPAGSINAGANRTFALGPPFGRSKITARIGVDPAEMDLEVYAGPDDRIGTFTWAQAARIGVFDGAILELDRLFAPASAAASPTTIDAATLGCLVWFYGRVAETDLGRSRILFKIRTMMDIPSTSQFPTRVYESACSLAFGGVACGYDRQNGKNALGVATGIGAVTVTASPGSSQGFLYTGGIPLSSDYAAGTIIGATGANAGSRRTIANLGDGTGQVGLFQAFLHPVVVGDTFTALPGCDHSPGAGGCGGRNNLDRYGGMPHIPPPESAI